MARLAKTACTPASTSNTRRAWGLRVVRANSLRIQERMAMRTLLPGAVVCDTMGGQRVEVRPEAAEVFLDGAGRAGEQLADPGTRGHGKPLPEGGGLRYNWKDNDPSAQTVRPGAVGPGRR